MKTNVLQHRVLAAVTGVLLVGTGLVGAQEAPATTPATPTASSAAQTSYGTADVVKLAHANISEDTILSFVQHSDRGYNLSASDIVTLREAGVTDRVINAMLEKKAPVVLASAPAATVVPATTATTTTTVAAPAAASTTSAATERNNPATPTTVVTQPVTTYVETPTYVAPAPVYVTPNYYYGYPYYGSGYYGYPYRYYGGPALSFSFGFGGHGGHHQ